MRLGRGGHRTRARLAAPVPISRSDAGRLFRCKPNTSAQTAASGTNPPLRCGLSSPLQTSCYRTNHPLRYAPAAPVQADHVVSSPAPGIGFPVAFRSFPAGLQSVSAPSIFRRTRPFSRPFPRSFLPLSYRAAQYLAIPLADPRAACRITPRSLSNYLAQSAKSSSPRRKHLRRKLKVLCSAFFQESGKKSPAKTQQTPPKSTKTAPGPYGPGAAKLW